MIPSLRGAHRPSEGASEGRARRANPGELSRTRRVLLLTALLLAPSLVMAQGREQPAEPKRRATTAVDVGLATHLPATALDVQAHGFTIMDGLLQLEGELALGADPDYNVVLLGEAHLGFPFELGSRGRESRADSFGGVPMDSKQRAGTRERMVEQWYASPQVGALFTLGNGPYETYVSTSEDASTRHGRYTALAVGVSFARRSLEKQTFGGMNAETPRIQTFALRLLYAEMDVDGPEAENNTGFWLQYQGTVGPARAPWVYQLGFGNKPLWGWSGHISVSMPLVWEIQ